MIDKIDKQEAPQPTTDESTMTVAEKTVSGDARVIYSSFVAELATQAWAEADGVKAAA